MSRAWSGKRSRGGFAPRPRSLWRRFLDLALATAILALLGLLAARLDRVETRRSEGQPVVNDGDTITLAGERIRLRGLDAPELGQTCNAGGKNYPCGRSSRDTLVRLIDRRPVACEGWERDRFRRLLAVCRVDGANINAAMVESGWAVAYGDFETEEARARAAGAGLWAGSFERPREWRDSHGGMAEIEHGSFGLMANWLREMLRFR